MAQKQRMNMSIEQVAAGVLSQCGSVSGTVERLVLRRTAELHAHADRVRTFFGGRSSKVSELIQACAPTASDGPIGSSFLVDPILQATEELFSSEVRRRLQRQEDVLESIAELAAEVRAGDDGLPIPRLE